MALVARPQAPARPPAPPSFKQDFLNYERKRIVKGSVTNVKDKVKHLVDIVRNKEPRENTDLGGKIDFARLSKQTYLPMEKRGVEGFDIVPEFTTEDRTVYYHKDTQKAIIAFRGTDTHDWGHGVKGFFHSRGFRDITSDLALAAGEQNRSHRFKNAENVTKAVIERYGHKNVIATGHSLGGSQAVHVSNKFGIHAEAYNPHVDWLSASTFGNAYNTALHVNTTDPVAAFWRGMDWQSTDVRYNKKAAPFLGQHGIDNFLLPPKSKPKLGGGTGALPSVKSIPRKTVKYTVPGNLNIVPHQQTMSANPVQPRSNHRVPSHLPEQIYGAHSKTKTRKVRARRKKAHGGPGQRWGHGIAAADEREQSRVSYV
jgi:hypothetical protein